MSEEMDVARRFIDAFNGRDLEPVLGDFDPAVRLDEWPEAPGARSYRGPEGVRTAIDSWFESWEWMHVGVEDAVEAPGRVLVTLRQRARGFGSGAEVEVRSFAVFAFEDGKVTGIHLFIEREPALAAAGLAPAHEEDKR